MRRTVKILGATRHYRKRRDRETVKLPEIIFGTAMLEKSILY